MRWLSKFKSPKVASTAPAISDLTNPAQDDKAQAPLQIAKRLEKDGKRGAALRLLNDAIASNPADIELWLARGSIYYEWSRNIEARSAYQDAVRRFPDNVNAIARSGWASHALGYVAEAETLMRRVVDMRPDEADAHYGLGVVLQAAKEYESAAECFRAVIDIEADAAHAHTNLGVCLMDLGRFSAAEPSLRRATELMKDSPGVWSNLGVALYRQGNPAAEAAYRNALRLEIERGEFVDAFVSYASYLRNVDRVDEAIEIYNRFLPDHPNTAGLTQLGMCYLHVGDFEKGWNLYEFRWLQEPLISLRANLDTPVWQGQDLTGKTILVRAEQGVGDVVQFAGYLQRVRALGATVLFQGRDGMEALTTRFAGIDQIVNSGEKLPEFDYYTNLMSLPRFFGNDPKSQSRCVPYISIDTEQAARFHRQLSSNTLNIGLVWAGNPTHLQDKLRSIPLEFLETLTAIPGIRLYSLQKGEAAKQLAESDPDGRIVDWSHQLGHFGDTADAISVLDVVISVDTSVAHLAGAIGKPVWILLPKPAEWRWLDDRTHSDWYPRARLFRQSVQGDWATVIKELVTVIQDIVRDRSVIDVPSIASRNSPPLPPLERTEFAPVSVPTGLSAIGEMREGIFQYHLNKNQDQGIALRWYGEWHHDQLALLARLVKLDQVIVEVGGGVGVHTVALSRLVGLHGHVVVYENDKRVKMLLRQNLRSNKARNVTVMMYPARSMARANLIAEFESIDDLELQRLDWIKVNAAEDSLTVLEGGAATIWRARPKLFINVSDQNDDVLSKLAELGYVCWMHKSAVYRKKNFNNLGTPMAQHRTQLAILAIPEEVEVDVDLSDCVKLSQAA